jgi:hypothetical protein
VKLQSPSAMEKLEQLSSFMNGVALDVRLRPTHTSLFLAICHAWSTSQFADAFHVSRRRLMFAAHIRSIATYHKVIGDLQVFGYLDYWPSYHPVKGSRVRLKVLQGHWTFHRHLLMWLHDLRLSLWSPFYEIGRPYADIGMWFPHTWTDLSITSRRWRALRGRPRKHLVFGLFGALRG